MANTSITPGTMTPVGSGGSAVPGFRVLPTGSTWDDVLAAYAAASSGDAIMLPNETIQFTSSPDITKSIRITGHPGGLSKLEVQSNIAAHGSSGMFFVGFGAAPINVRFDHFEIYHNRGAMGSSGREYCFSIGNKIASCEIDHMLFTDITSDVAHTYDDQLNTTTFNISFHDNIVNEWYETVFLTRVGSMSGLYIYNNVCTTTAAHPSAPSTVSAPYGFAVSEEDNTNPIIVSNVYVCNNTIDASGVVNRGTMANSLGLVVSRSNSLDYCLFQNVNFINNIVKGFYLGAKILNVNDYTHATPEREPYISSCPIGVRGSVLLKDNQISASDSYNAYFDITAVGLTNDLFVATNNIFGTPFENYGAGLRTIVQYNT